MTLRFFREARQAFAVVCLVDMLIISSVLLWWCWICDSFHQRQFRDVARQDLSIYNNSAISRQLKEYLNCRHEFPRSWSRSWWPRAGRRRQRKQRRPSWSKTYREDGRRGNVSSRFGLRSQCWEQGEKGRIRGRTSRATSCLCCYTVAAATTIRLYR